MNEFLGGEGSAVVCNAGRNMVNSSKSWLGTYRQLKFVFKHSFRKAEEEFIADRDSSKDGAEWDRIAKLCEFNSKNSKSSSDLSRLRGLLLQLKSQKE